MIHFFCRLVITNFLFLVLFLLLPDEIFADGIQLSSTKVGTTATFTGQIPADPCGVHKLGETKNRTVVGFVVDTTPFNMGDDQVMRILNEKRADLTDAIVSDFTISGRKITDFKSSPEDYSTLNWQDFIHSRRTFILSSPIEFTPQDSASITVSNVKIINKGTINPEFVLLEPNGQFCLGAKYTILTLGESQKALPKVAEISPTIKKLPSPSLVPSKSASSLTPTKAATIQNKPIKSVEKELSPIEKIMKWLFSFIRN